MPMPLNKLSTQKNPPLVSVCIPVYNGERYIEETIQSVMNQSYVNIEILVQDNASQDGTRDILNALSCRDSRLSVMSNATNLGMAPNWNLVVNRARGEYIMLLSADDLINPDFVTTCLDIFSRSDVAGVTTNYFLLKKNGPVKRKTSPSQNIYQNFAGRVILTNPFLINFSLFKRATVEQLKRKGSLFRDSFMACDFDLWIRTALAGMPIYHLKRQMGFYRVHDANLSRQVLHIKRQAALVVLSHKKSLKRLHPFLYKASLIRFISRFVMLSLTTGTAPNRILFVLLRELFS